MEKIILIGTAFSLFFGYVLACLLSFGIPKSLSETFYLIKEKKKENSFAPYTFTVTLWLVAFMLFYPWMDCVSNPDLEFFPFLACGGIMFVGAAPHFKGSEKYIHYISACMSFVFAYLFSLVDHHECVITVFWTSLSVLLILVFKKPVFFVEMGAFALMFHLLIKSVLP